MEQTNRTILFTEINSEKDDLLTLISEEEKRRGLNDEEIFRIHEKLEVKSYNDFLQKFEPSVNMILNTEQCTVSFFQNTMQNYGQKIMLDTEDSLLAMFMRLIDAKKNKRYILTCFEDMITNFIPIGDVKAFLNQRNIILAETEKEHVNREFIKTEIMKLWKQFDDGIFLLNVFLQDVSDFIFENPKSDMRDKGILDDEGRMQIRVIKKAKKYKNTGVYKNIQKQLYKELIEQCMEKARQEGKYQNVSLMGACMLLPVLYAEKDFYNIQKQYEIYSRLYIDMIKKFWISAKPLIETVLGVREFFEQYQNTEGMQPCLIISNFKIADLVQPKNKEILELYLNTVNTKSYYQNTIWYAIVPNIASEDKAKERIVRERFQTNQEQYSYERNEIEEVIQLLESLAKYRIQSFISMPLTQEHTFSALAKNGLSVVTDFLRLFGKMDGKDYCIPCYPNFILVSKEEACQKVGQILFYNELSEKIEVKGEKLLWLDEIGIEASYVAAGLVAACQCPNYLKKCFGTGVNEKFPGVAYRFSEQSHYLKTTSGMLSETIDLTEEMVAELIAGSRGILFGQKDGKTVMLTDRTLSYSESNKLLISMVQTVSYIERRIQYETQDFKKNLIHQFFQKRPGSVISQWAMADGGVINTILREDEELEYKIDEVDNSCVFHLRFKDHELVRSETVSIFKE